MTDLQKWWIALLEEVEQKLGKEKPMEKKIGEQDCKKCRFNVIYIDAPCKDCTIDNDKFEPKEKPVEKKERWCSNCGNNVEPCLSCYESNNWVEEKPMEKKCQNCRYTEVPNGRQPCNVCIAPNRVNWEAVEKTMEKKDQISEEMADKLIEKTYWGECQTQKDWDKFQKAKWKRNGLIEQSPLDKAEEILTLLNTRFHKFRDCAWLEDVNEMYMILVQHIKQLEALNE